MASPWRRRLLDLLRNGPATTGALAGQIPELSRSAVMQHLGVLADAGGRRPALRGLGWRAATCMARSRSTCTRSS
ncbi:MAG TPA: helix-turn-helix domain-containing protein [Streptosporangiaceae bacterium]|nr:helix-turn-helix domain-containing protein [Streptosporangiaceae bacterium]